MYWFYFNVYLTGAVHTALPHERGNVMLTRHLASANLQSIMRPRECSHLTPCQWTSRDTSRHSSQSGQAETLYDTVFCISGPSCVVNCFTRVSFCIVVNRKNAFWARWGFGKSASTLITVPPYCQSSIYFLKYIHGLTYWLYMKVDGVIVMLLWFWKCILTAVSAWQWAERVGHPAPGHPPAGK